MYSLKGLSLYFCQARFPECTWLMLYEHIYPHLACMNRLGLVRLADFLHLQGI